MNVIDHAFYHCIDICFAKNNFPSDKTIEALFSNFVWRQFCFRSNISVPKSKIFLDLFESFYDVFLLKNTSLVYVAVVRFFSSFDLPINEKYS